MQYPYYLTSQLTPSSHKDPFLTKLYLLGLVTWIYAGKSICLQQLQISYLWATIDIHCTTYYVFCTQKPVACPSWNQFSATCHTYLYCSFIYYKNESRVQLNLNELTTFETCIWVLIPGMILYHVWSTVRMSGMREI